MGDSNSNGQPGMARRSITTSRRGRRSVRGNIMQSIADGHFHSSIHCTFELSALDDEGREGFACIGLSWPASTFSRILSGARAALDFVGGKSAT